MGLRKIGKGDRIRVTEKMRVRIPGTDAKEIIRAGTVFVCGDGGKVNPDEIEVTQKDGPMRYAIIAELTAVAEPA